MKISYALDTYGGDGKLYPVLTIRLPRWVDTFIRWRYARRRA